MVVPDNVLRGRGRGVDRAPSRPRRLRRQLQGRGAGKALGDRAVPPLTDDDLMAGTRPTSTSSGCVTRAWRTPTTSRPPASSLPRSLRTSSRRWPSSPNSLSPSMASTSRSRRSTWTPRFGRPNSSSCSHSAHRAASNARTCGTRRTSGGRCGVTLRPHHHSLPSVAGRRGNRRCHGRTGTRSSTSWRRTTRVNHVQERP